MEIEVPVEKLDVGIPVVVGVLGRSETSEPLEIVVRRATCGQLKGEGFDPERVRDPLTGENLLRPNGRGILFMREFMDQIDYTFDADGGTIVTLRKRLQDVDDSVTEEENQK